MSLLKPDQEQADDEDEADHSGPLHDRERNRLAADLFDQAPEDVAAVERQKREQVDHAQREADQGDQGQRLSRADVDRLAGHLVAPGHPGELLTLLGLVDVRERGRPSSR